jgi:hypothetical protein
LTAAGTADGARAQDTAARLSALLHRVFLYDRGSQLRVIEESGLSLTQCKALLSAPQRHKLDAAVDSLMDREDIAQTYEHLKGVGPA